MVSIVGDLTPTGIYFNAHHYDTITAQIHS